MNELDSKIDILLAEYLQRVDSGTKGDVSQFLAEHPEQADELRELIETDDMLAQLYSKEPTHDIAPTILSDSAADVPDAGTRIRYVGDYELLNEIARGGMGIVYRARQLSLNRDVAIKMIRAGELADDDEVLRFQREAEAVAGLQHPNIVAVHEIGTHAGHSYFSMDLVEGTNLAAKVREHPLPARDAAEYVRQTAEAIHYAHEQGTLHRDLKPSNILVDEANQVRITDFGLSKRVESDSSLTMTGQVLGTPCYMPPEQATGDRTQLGPTSDVYALGAVLYELLTERKPFSAATTMETIQQVLEQDAVSPRLLNPGIPHDLETICLKCLEKSPAQRYQTAQQLADELNRFLKGEPILARPLSRVARVGRWCRRYPFTAAAVLAICMLLSLVTFQSIHVAQQAESILIDERQTDNFVDAQRLATLISLRMNEWRDTVDNAAQELGAHVPQIAKLQTAVINEDEMKLQIKQADPDRELQRFCQTWQAELGKGEEGESVFASWYLFNSRGVLLAYWQKNMRDGKERVDPIGKEFAGRDYVEQHLRNPKNGETYISRLFLSESDNVYKYAFSAPIFDDEGTFLGVVAGASGVDPTLGGYELSAKNQKVVVVGRGDENAPRPGGVAHKLRFPILIHDDYTPSQDPVDFKNARLWDNPPVEYDNRHVDPIRGGRWLAAFAPVGETELRVVVQQKYSDAIPPVLRLASRLVLWVGAAVSLGLLMFGTAVVYWIKRTHKQHAT